MHIAYIITAAIATAVIAMLVTQTPIAFAAIATASAGGGLTSAGTTTTTSTSSGSFASVKVVQDKDFVVITVGRSGETIPEGPIVVVPPEDPAENGTIIVPDENVTNTEEPSDNVIVIEPDGNVTEVQGNVTNIDNETVIIAPVDQNVTETPGGVVVVDPPVDDCGCPVGPSDEGGVVTGEEPVPPVTEEPLPAEPEAPTQDNATTDNGVNATEIAVDSNDDSPAPEEGSSDGVTANFLNLLGLQ